MNKILLFSLFFILISLNAMEDLDKSKLYNIEFKEKLVKIKKSTSKILNENSKLNLFERSERSRIIFMQERIRSILNFSKQSDTGNLLYYNHFARWALDDVISFSNDFLEYSKKQKITETRYKKHQRNIESLETTVSNIERHAPQINTKFNLNVEFSTYNVGLGSLFGEGFFKTHTS